MISFMLFIISIITIFTIITFFFNDTATTEIYTLSLHDALPILRLAPCTCYADKTTSLRYQATFRMPPRSNAGIGPNYQAQLDAPMSEPFPKLKQARQPPMLKYEQLTDDEKYASTLYKE